MSSRLTVTARGAALATITLLTLVCAGTAGAAVLASASSAHKMDDLLGVGVVLGLPLSTTLLGTLAVRRAVLVTAGLTLVALAAAAAGLAVGQYAVNGWPDPCVLAPAACGPSFDPVSATVIGAALAGAVPALIYLAATRTLRPRPGTLMFAYLMSLPAFGVWAGLVMLAARLLTTSSNLPVD